MAERKAVDETMFRPGTVSFELCRALSRRGSSVQGQLFIDADFALEHAHNLPTWDRSRSALRVAVWTAQRSGVPLTLVDDEVALPLNDDELATVCARLAGHIAASQASYKRLTQTEFDFERVEKLLKGKAKSC